MSIVPTKKLASNAEHAPEESSKMKTSHVNEVPAEPAEDIGKGWVQRKVLRANGKGSNTYFYSPNDNIKVRSRVEAQRLIVKLEETGGDETKAWQLVKEDEKREREEKKEKKRKLGEAVLDVEDQAKSSKKKLEEAGMDVEDQAKSSKKKKTKKRKQEVTA
jgi:hypothetical protein